MWSSAEHRCSASGARQGRSGGESSYSNRRCRSAAGAMESGCAQLGLEGSLICHTPENAAGGAERVVPSNSRHRPRVFGAPDRRAVATERRLRRSPTSSVSTSRPWRNSARQPSMSKLPPCRSRLPVARAPPPGAVAFRDVPPGGAVPNNPAKSLWPVLSPRTTLTPTPAHSSMSMRIRWTCIGRMASCCGRSAGRGAVRVSSSPSRDCSLPAAVSTYMIRI